MDHFEIGLTFVQIIVIIVSVFNPRAMKIVEKTIGIVYSLHSMYEEEKKAHKETRMELEKIKEVHKECGKNLPDMIV